MKLKNETYDVLKWVAQVALPAVLTFIGVVMTTLDIPHVEAVLTIGAAADTLLGALLGVSTANYIKEQEEE
jgi:Na+/H+ antiporter NhaA